MIDKNTSIDEIEFVAFDFETTGLNPNIAQIIEMGAIRFTTSGEVGRFQQLVHPTVGMSSEIIKIHSITPDMLTDAPPISDVLPDFLKFISSSVLIAHNIAFDLSFLNVAVQRAELAMIDNITIDTVALARRVMPNARSYKLDQLAESIGVNMPVSHRALEDAVMCMELFHYCVEQISFIGMMSLSELL